MRKPIYVFGAGGLGREVIAMLGQFEDFIVNGVYDDFIPVGNIVNGCPCLGGLDQLVNSSSPIDVVIALGEPTTKHRISERLTVNKNIGFPVLIHPKAVILDKSRVKIGMGTIIAAGAILTTEIEVGKHVLVNINATIGHDTRVGDCCSIMPSANLSGYVNVGNSALIGTGATILNGVKVGDRVKVGAGAVVTSDVSVGSIVVGIPARQLTKK